MSFAEKIMILSGTLWLTALAFIVYAWMTQMRQRAILRYIARRLDGIEQALKPAKTLPRATETQITIDKNEPLSKYETVTLPDEIDINFVDR